MQWALVAVASAAILGGCADDSPFGGELAVTEHFVDTNEQGADYNSDTFCTPATQVDGPPTIVINELRRVPCTIDCSIPFEQVGDELRAMTSTTETVFYSPGSHGCRRWVSEYRVHRDADDSIVYERWTKTSLGIDGVCTPLEQARTYTACSSSELIRARR